MVSTSLWQYDTGQQLRITGISRLSETTEVHFGLKYTDRAIVKTGEYQDNALTVDIPNLFLEYADSTPAKVWVHIRESESAAKTILEIHIPIIPRERPDDYISPEDIAGSTAIQIAVNSYLDAHPEEYTGYTKAEADRIISQMISRAAAAKIKSYDTVAEMKSDTALSAGKLVRTVGYYSPNDGGGAFYKIVSSTSAYAETINNNLYAELIVDGGCKNARCYGAKGDNVTDDTSALQAWLNDVAINGGYAYLPRGRYKITAPLTVDWGHHGGNPRNFLQRLIGDGCTSYESNYDNTCIIASNIGEKRGAIEFVSDGNTWGTQVEISNIGIYCDSTCHAMSFCLFYGDSRQLILRKVKMRGNNNLYVRCGSKNGGTSSYEHLCVSIEHCDLLIRGSQTKGFSLLPESIGIENSQAFSMFDNLAVHNTVIGGLFVAHVNNLTVNDCVVSIDNIKNKVKTTSNCGRFNGYEIDYATGILIVETASTIIRNLYCEDYRRAIDISPICGNIRSVIVEGSYFNPGCNQYDDNNNLIKSDYGIFIRDGGANFKVAHVEIVHNVFRHDGTNVEFANAAVYNGAAKEIIIRSNAGRPALNADQIVNNAGEVVSIDAVFTTGYKSKLDNIDTVPTKNSDNLITSGAVFAAIQAINGGA